MVLQDSHGARSLTLDIVEMVGETCPSAATEGMRFALVIRRAVGTRIPIDHDLVDGSSLPFRDIGRTSQPGESQSGSCSYSPHVDAKGKISKTGETRLQLSSEGDWI